MSIFKKKKAAAEAAAPVDGGAGGGDGAHTHGAGGEVVAGGGGAVPGAEAIAADPAVPVADPTAVNTPVADPTKAGVAVVSDMRAKEKIERTGKSPSGIPIYEFNYIGGSNRYSGAMAQDLLEMNIDAVSLSEDGYYKVNYNNIDVDMRLIN